MSWVKTSSWRCSASGSWASVGNSGMSDPASVLIALTSLRPDQFLHVVEELERRERLGEEVVGARGAAGVLGLRVVARRQHEDPRVLVVHLPAHVHTVYTRHHHVEDDEPGLAVLDQLQRR